MVRIPTRLSCVRVSVFPCFLAAAVAVAAFSSPASAAASFVAGRDAHLSGRHREAISALLGYLAESPRDAVAWMWLGASYYDLGAIPEAAAAFERANALSPSGDVALWLGAAYTRLGREDDARQAFTQAIRLGRPQTALLAQQWLRAAQGRHVPVLGYDARPEHYAYVARWYNPSLTPQQVDAIVRSVLYYGYTYGVDPRLVMALIAVESGFRITARSPAGAYGLGQLMPETSRAMGVNPADPVANIYGTVRVLRGQLARFGSNQALALAAYNAGHGAVTRYGGIPPYNETQWYVYNVLTLYRYLVGG